LPQLPIFLFHLIIPEELFTFSLWSDNQKYSCMKFIILVLKIGGYKLKDLSLD
jgi:hypothetical protein